MARNKIFDPAFLKAHTENILKDKKLQAQWHEARMQQVPVSCQFDDEPDDDEIQEPQFETPEQTQVEVPEVEEMTEHFSVEKVLQSEEGNVKIPLLEIMKPVPSKTKKLLYIEGKRLRSCPEVAVRGLSHDQEGKAKYLRKRRALDPEEKFYFPICSSWEYGWTYGQEFALKCPDHGKREIIKASFYRSNDPQLKPRR